MRSINHYPNILDHLTMIVLTTEKTQILNFAPQFSLSTPPKNHFSFPNIPKKFFLKITNPSKYSLALEKSLDNQTTSLTTVTNQAWKE